MNEHFLAMSAAVPPVMPRSVIVPQAEHLDAEPEHIADSGRIRIGAGYRLPADRAEA